MFAGRERAAMGLHIEFIRVCLGKTPHFPKPPRPVICILIVSAFTSWSAPAQPSDWNIMTLMMPLSLPFSCFLPHLLSRLSITFLFHHHGFLTSFAVSPQPDFTSPFHHSYLMNTVQCNCVSWHMERSCVREVQNSGVIEPILQGCPGSCKHACNL